jgi:aminoglycoside phosphotransferase (APT) family kinase protein
MGREFRVLSVLHKGFPLAPRAFVYCEDPAIIGKPFFVMERRRGLVVRREVPARFGGGADTEANRKLSTVMIDTLAQFHAVDYRAVGLETLGKPEGFLRRQIDGWAQRYERTQTRQLPVVGEIVAWLRAEQPPSPPPTLLHNDWRLDNIMMDAADPGRVVAVFDWEMTALGDPLIDVGILLAYWTSVVAGGDPASAEPLTAREGWFSRDQIVERYAQQSGRDVSGMRFYEIFAVFKVAVIVQQIFYRYQHGQTDDPRFARFDARVASLARRGKTLIDRLVLGP